MTQSNTIRKVREVAPKATIFLVLSYAVHLGEEWFAGFLDWTPVALGYAITVERFIVINATSFVVFAIGTLGAIRYPSMSWFAVVLAALLGLNGILHTVATVGFGYYSPGTVTGLLLYVPLSIMILKQMSTKLPASTFTGSVILGGLLHALVAFLAFI